MNKAAACMGAPMLGTILAMPGDPVEDITATERVGFALKDGAIVHR